MTGLYILLAVVGLALLGAVAIYNRLIKNQNLVQEGWSGIDVQLKRRHDLIPNLIETVKGYMGHERGVLEKVTELRTQSLQTTQIGEKGQVEGALTQALRSLFAVAEAYPDLKASQNFIELQKTLADVEDQIQLARRYYNGAARDLNIVIGSFPSNLVANAFGFTRAEYFQVEEAGDRAVPQVSFP
jgi:LemA protein